MAMRVVAEERGVVRLEHTVLRSEPRNHAVRFEPHLRVGGYSSRRCSICGRIARGERWLEPDTEEARELTELNGAIRVIYGVCEPCRSMVPRASPAAI